MLRKILFPFAILVLYALPLNAQAVQVSLSYQSIRPFVHFQLDFGRRVRHSPYRSAYLKGYMDGVNRQYYYDHRFHEMVENVRIYKSGYRDGIRDRGLVVRLRGRRWLQNNCFDYEDYYSPNASVRIWLKGMTLAFLTAPARRLPPGWRHKISHRAKKYRHQMRKRYRRNNKWSKKRHHRNKRWRGRQDFDDYGDRYEKNEDDRDG